MTIDAARARHDARALARSSGQAPGDAPARAPGDEGGGREPRRRRTDRQVERDDDRVARAGDESGQARAEARSPPPAPAAPPPSAPTRRLESSAIDAGPRWRRGPAEHEAIDAGIEVAERPQLLPQLVDARVVLVGCSSLAVQRVCARRRKPTAPAGGRRPAPNGASARSAVWHNSAASCRAPSTPLNDTKVVLRASCAHRFAGFGRVAVDVEQVVDDLEREAEVLARTPRATAIGSALAPAVIAPAAAAATNSAPVLPRWIRSSVSKLIVAIGGQQVGRLPGDESVSSRRRRQRARDSAPPAPAGYDRAQIVTYAWFSSPNAARIAIASPNST